LLAAARPCQAKRRAPAHTRRSTGEPAHARRTAGSSTRAKTQEARPAQAKTSRISPKRNGGRHRCQPPLRRAKDMPVFVTWSASTRRPTPTRSRSWLTSSGVASHPTAPSVRRSPTPLPQCATRRLASVSGHPAWPESQSHLTFRGPSWGNHSCVPLRSQTFRGRSKSRVALEAITSSGASSRLTPHPLPKEPQHCLPAEIGSLVTCRTRLAVAGFLERPEPPSRSPSDHALVVRVGEAKNRGRSLWITGISGTTVGPVRTTARLLKSPPAPTSTKCLNLLN
jgi:hypothetical protein